MYGKKKMYGGKKKYQGGITQNFKAGRSREEVHNTPGGTGGGPKRGDTMSRMESKPAKTIPSGVERSLKTPPKKLTYADAKKKDPKLDSYIKKRNALRDAGKKSSAEYRAVQNKINAAYGVSKRRRETPNVEKMESKTVSSMRTASKAKFKGTTGSKSKSTPTSKSKGSTESSTASKRKTGAASKDKAVAGQLRDIGIEDNKEVTFDSPSTKKSTSKKEARKSRRRAIKESRKKGREERRALRRRK